MRASFMGKLYRYMKEMRVYKYINYIYIHICSANLYAGMAYRDAYLCVRQWFPEDACRVACMKTRSESDNEVMNRALRKFGESIKEPGGITCSASLN